VFVVCCRPTGDGYGFQTLKPGITAETDFYNSSTLSDADAQNTKYQTFLVFVCKFGAIKYTSMLIFVTLLLRLQEWHLTLH